jgi:signal transduction histidine kinase
MVKGALASPLPIDEAIGPASFSVYENRPRPSLGPRSAPPLGREELESPSFSVRSDGVRYRGWTHASESATEVVLLAAPSPFETIERIGVHVLGTALLIAAFGLTLWVAAGSGRQRLTRGWQQVYRSYSKKLLVVYGLLLLLPLSLLSIVLLGVLGDRLGRSQEIAAESAMEAAQHVLGEYVLSLEPGFGVDTAIDDDLLAWLARVIDHEVNLYWGSTLYASSNPELFTAGFLPARIPGDIYAELAIESANSASRPRQANRERYIELYAPLRIPGIRSQETLFLSIPLLAQQEQAAREIAVLRTRVVLVALLLLAAVAAVASRLSHNFTLPLMRLVEGTQAIAGGASSVDLEPTELELASLVDAINDMARKIAEARENLVREKQVMEKMVQNITAGVVSLDGDRRVLLRNRVAAEILGVDVGESLSQALEGDERLSPLSDFLTTIGDQPSQGTLVVHAGEGEARDWSVVWVPLPGEGEPTSLLVVEDVSEVVRGQRLQAWAEMARMIAHEIKNPLTPIRLSTEHMVDVRESNPEAFDDVFERCSRNILHQVDELHQIATEFSTYSRIPQVDRSRGDLVAAVREVVDSYGAAPPKGITIALESSVDTLEAHFDRRLFGRALRNLLENALKASGKGGRVKVTVEVASDQVAVSVADRGPGVDAETLDRMFDPYFSDSGGTGLGLPISRRIIEEHGGTLTAANRPGGGLTSTIRLPLGSDSDPAVS